MTPTPAAYDRFDRARVKHFRRAIRTGTFRVDSARVAAALLSARETRRLRDYGARAAAAGALLIRVQ